MVLQLQRQKAIRRIAAFVAVITTVVLILNASTPDDLKSLKSLKYCKAPDEIVSSFKVMVPCQREGVGLTGGYCLSEADITVGGNHIWDIQICKYLEKMVGYSSVVDLGAGLGHYGKCLLRTKDSIFSLKNKEQEIKMHDEFLKTMGDLLQKPQVIKSYNGYDGALNIEYFSKGFIKDQDLSTKNMWLGRTWDWVMSLEVGEHIPPQYEENFIDNLIRHGCKGIVLSWALEHQGGHHHVNQRNNDYIKKKMAEKGLINDIMAEELMRSRTSVAWFKNTLMVFRYPSDYKCECPL